MPFLRRELPDIRLVTGIVDLLGVDDVQNQFGIHIAADTAHADIRVGVLGRLFEIGDRLYRVPVIDRVASPVKQPQAVEQLIDFGRRLVYVHHHQFPPVSLFLQEHDYFFGIGRRQSRRRFVEIQDSRLAYQFESDIQALPLASTDRLTDRGTDFEIFYLFQVQFLQYLFHTLSDLLVRQTGETEPCRVQKVLVNGQLLDQQIILRDKTDQLACLRRVERMPVHGYHPLVGTDIAVHDSQQSRLPDPATAHNGYELPGFEIEREVMQSVMAVLKRKINVTSGEMNDLLAFVLIKNGQQVAVIDRQEQRPLQHTAMLPGIKHIRRKRNVVHKNLPVPMIGKNMLIEATDIEHTDETFHPFPRDMVGIRLLLPADRQQRRRRFSCDKCKRIVKFFLGNRKDIGHQAEQIRMPIRLPAVRIGELYETDQ